MITIKDFEDQKFRELTNEKAEELSRYVAKHIEEACRKVIQEFRCLPEIEVNYFERTWTFKIKGNVVGRVRVDYENEQFIVRTEDDSH